VRSAAVEFTVNTGVLNATVAGNILLDKFSPVTPIPLLATL
jgi:hypothetical protein